MVSIVSIMEFVSMWGESAMSFLSSVALVSFLAALSYILLSMNTMSKQIKKIADTFDWVGDATYLSASKLGYIEKRIMQGELRPHEFIRLVLSQCEEYEVARDVSWLSRSFSDTLSNFFEVRCPEFSIEHVLIEVRFLLSICVARGDETTVSRLRMLGEFEDQYFLTMRQYFWIEKLFTEPVLNADVRHLRYQLSFTPLQHEHCCMGDGLEEFVSRIEWR
jgi:hypothetical protein